MADQEVIIVDDAGTEHIFPPGFDPKRAAGIVRDRATAAAAPSIPRDARGLPQVSADVQEGGPSLFQRTVQGMVNPSPEMQLGMDVLPFAAGAIGPGISRLRGAPPMAVSHGATPVRDWIRTSGVVMEQAPAAGATGRFVGRLMQKVPTPQTFQDLPLAQQMEQLPSATPAPVTGRLGMAPYQAPPTPFHELPLAQQMPQLPTTGGIPLARSSGPPLQAPPTPFHELPLAQQMSQLPTTGGIPMARSGGPPLQPQTPFHELPVFKQMEQLPTTGPAPVTGRLAIAPHQMASDATMLKSLMQESSTALNPWESNFLESVSANISGGRALTPGQSNALRSIYLRANMPR